MREIEFRNRLDRARRRPIGGAFRIHRNRTERTWRDDVRPGQRNEPPLGQAALLLDRRLSIVDPDSHAPGSDPVYDRLRKTAAFLAQRRYTGTAEVSAPAKVHLLSRTDRDRAAG